jgi:hypothetical protein
VNAWQLKSQTQNRATFRRDSFHKKKAPARLEPERALKVKNLMAEIHRLDAFRKAQNPDTENSTGRKKPLIKRHGMSKTPEWRTWQDMKRRCHSEGCRDFSHYGARGITVCDRWRFGNGERSGFQCFYADLGPRPTPLHTIDRKDNSKGYFQSNCRWATRAEQARNREPVKLNPDKVRAIIASTEAHAVLAERYGVALKYIWRVRSGGTWRDVFESLNREARAA